jgi:hypothetical protein
MTRPEVVGMISKVLFKVYVYLKERFDPKYPITDEEKYFTEICPGTETWRLTICRSF